MAYDLVIKNGTVIDGSGLPRFRADVGVRHGKIVSIGRIRERAREVLDADGQVVAPGFVDGHTHMDAQVFWDPLGTSSCWHGITSVVMGNCGFTLAPCAEKDKHLVVRNLQRAEDIPPAAMEAGIKWSWTTFPEFLDVLDRLPKGINYSGYVGHSALRTYAMGERAFEAGSTEDDLRAMERELRDALRAGAMGFTTSRSPSHETPDRRPVASRMASWDEVRRLVGVMGEMNAGVFELAGENVDRDANNPGRPRLPHAAARPGGGERAAHHLRRVQPAHLARHVAEVPGPPRRDRGDGRPDVRPVPQPLAERAAVVPDPAAVRSPAGLEGDPQAAAGGAEAAAARPRGAPPPDRGHRHQAGRHPARHRGQAGRLRLDPRVRQGRRPAPLGGRDRAGAQPASGRGHDRPGAGEEPRPLLPAADRQREPGLRAGDHAPPAHGHHVLGLRRPRLAAHGLLAADAPAQPLGARRSRRSRWSRRCGCSRWCRPPTGASTTAA